MKKIATLFALCLMGSMHAQNNDARLRECWDVMEEIKAGVPYAHPNDANYVAAKIECEANKDADNPFAENKKDAQRRSKCAAFLYFANYGQYLTDQMELNNMQQDFLKEQQKNSALSKEEFFDDSVKSGKIDPKEKFSLVMGAKQRLIKPYATTEEQEIAEEWLAVLK